MARLCSYWLATNVVSFLDFQGLQYKIQDPRDGLPSSLEMWTFCTDANRNLAALPDHRYPNTMVSDVRTHILTSSQRTFGGFGSACQHVCLCGGVLSADGVSECHGATFHPVVCARAADIQLRIYVLTTRNTST